MPCSRLKQLFDACKESNMQLGALDVIRFVCKKCNVKDVCPSEKMVELESGPSEGLAVEPAPQ